VGAQPSKGYTHNPFTTIEQGLAIRLQIAHITYSDCAVDLSLQCHFRRTTTQHPLHRWISRKLPTAANAL